MERYKRGEAAWKFEYREDIEARIIELEGKSRTPEEEEELKQLKRKKNTLDAIGK